MAKCHTVSSSGALLEFQKPNLPKFMNDTAYVPKYKQAKPLPSLEILDEKLILDPETGILRWRKINPKCHRADGIAGCDNGSGYINIGIGSIYYKAHRLVWKIFHREEPPPCLDHVNGLTLDNRPCNLRAATLSDNAANTKYRTDNTSGVKGVHWDKRVQRWIVTCMHNGKRKSVGRFTDFDEACTISKVARENMHQEFTNHGIHKWVTDQV